MNSWRRRAPGRRRAIEALPDLYELVIVGVRAGLTPAAAITVAERHVAPALHPTLAEVVHRLARGARLADALGALPDQLGPAAAGFADALAAADRYGLPIEPVLDRLAVDARTERRRHAERHARTLPVRLAFPLVCCTLPAFVLLAIVPALLGALSTLRGLTP
jgi:Flp pilus assembly protein TadB